MWPRAALLVEQRRRFRNIEQALIGGSHESDPEHVSFDLAIVALIFGLGFVLVPGLMFSIYGITSAPASFLGFRLFGSALIAIGVLTWFLKDSANWEALLALLLSVAIGNVVGLLLVFFATINGTLSAMGWTAVLVYLLLLTGEGYFLSRPRGDAGARQVLAQAGLQHPC